MGNAMSNWVKDKGKGVILYIAFIILLILTLLGKNNLHIDEMYSYGLSNNVGSTNIIVENGYIYEPSDKPFMDYVTVEKEERFNYENVWTNQTIDVHPPLFYVILHTICSLFPERFSIWFAAFINIVFAMLTLYTLRKIVYNLTEDRMIQTFTSVMFIVSCGILSIATFLRMYVMAMFWVTLITYLFIKAVDVKTSWKDYVALDIVAILGAMTHYYCIVYLVFICFAYGTYLLIRRKWMDILYMVLSMMIAAYSSVAIFPAMLKHLFSGVRGTEAIDNLANASMCEYTERLKSFYGFINDQLFGGLLTYIAIFFLILIALTLLMKQYKGGNVLLLNDSDMESDNENIWNSFRAKWIIVAITVILFFLIVSKMAAYVTDRYISPVFAVTLIEVICGLYYGLKKLLRHRERYLCLCIVCTIMVVNSWRSGEWPYLYASSKSLLAKASEFSNIDCLILYDYTSKTQPDFYEVSKYKRVMFIPMDSMEMFKNTEYIKSTELMVIVIGGDENKVRTIIDWCPILEQFEKIDSFAYGTTYHLYGNKMQQKNYLLYSKKESLQIGKEQNDDGTCNAFLSEDDIKLEYIYDQEDGYGTIWCGNSVLDISKANMRAGTNVQWYPYNGTVAQKWRLCENSDGTYTIVSANDDLVLMYNRSGNVYLGNRNNGEYAKWVLK